MVIFCRQHPSNSAKKCRSLSSVLKDPFSSCHTCYRSHLPYSDPEEEETPIPDFDDVQKVVISMVISCAMEAKFRRKASMLSASGELFVDITKPRVYNEQSPHEHLNSKNKEEMEDFASVKSHFSSAPAVDGSEAYFSYCSSLKDVNKWSYFEVMDSCELKRRAIIQKFCRCEGWPFGLCRKALLLPPLPKSPSESWSWCKRTKGFLN